MLYPNPVSSLAHFRLWSEEACTYRIEIFSSLGRLVSLENVHHPGGGSYEYAWRVEDASGSRLSAGLYLFRIIGGNNLHCDEFIVK